MTEKLTLDDCYKYPNTRIKADTKDFKNVFTFTIYSFNSNLSSNQILREENCKLILRSIEQLTDEEKRYICREYLSNVKQSDIDWGSVFVVFCYCKTIKDTINLIDYLREKNIMIGPEDWFKSGKAVKDV